MRRLWVHGSAAPGSASRGCCPLLANLIVVAPLLLDAAASLRERELPHRSVLTEINSVLGYVGLVLLVYVLWLGWSQRRFLLSEIQARKLVPIALVFTAYLLSALVTTGVVAELAAVDLLTGLTGKLAGHLRDEARGAAGAGRAGAAPGGSTQRRLLRRGAGTIAPESVGDVVRDPLYLGRGRAGAAIHRQYHVTERFRPQCSRWGFE